ncbi:hypothetical protein LguiB_019073 [Lonicera macranthoides]
MVESSETTATVKGLMGYGAHNSQRSSLFNSRFNEHEDASSLSCLSLIQLYDKRIQCECFVIFAIALGRYFSVRPITLLSAAPAAITVVMKVYINCVEGTMNTSTSGRVSEKKGVSSKRKMKDNVSRSNKKQSRAVKKVGKKLGGLENLQLKKYLDQLCLDATSQ